MPLQIIKKKKNTNFNHFQDHAHSPIAHQFQLALVACAKTRTNVSDFFGKVNMVVNLIRSSNFGCYNYF